MRWLGRFVAAATAGLLSSGTGSASTASSTPASSPPTSATRADEAWATAVKQDSLEAYASFIMFYADSPHAQAAYDRLSGAKAPPKDDGGLPEPEAVQELLNQDALNQGALNQEPLNQEPLNREPLKTNSDKNLFGFSSVAGKIWGIV